MWWENWHLPGRNAKIGACKLYGIHTHNGSKNGTISLRFRRPDGRLFTVWLDRIELLSRLQNLVSSQVIEEKGGR